MISDFREQFRAAFAYFLNQEGRGSQSRLAEKIGIRQQVVSQIFNKLTDGNEEIRRKIATAYGYEYDDFLKFGEALMSGVKLVQDEVAKNSDIEFGELKMKQDLLEDTVKSMSRKAISPELASMYPKLPTYVGILNSYAKLGDDAAVRNIISTLRICAEDAEKKLNPPETAGSMC